MQTLFLSSLFIFGMLLGSFASVLIYRIKQKESGIIGGRSHCPNCQHTLGFFDLFPIFSYLSTLGKCRYCATKISTLYPLIELSMGSLFFGVGYFFSSPSLFSGNLLALSFFSLLLIIAFCSVVYVFYDIMYLEIPENVLIVANTSALLILFLKAFFFEFYLFSLPQFVLLSVLSLFIIAALYFIMTRAQDDKKDIFILSVIGMILILLHNVFGPLLWKFSPLHGAIAAYTMFVFFYIQYFFSKGKWIGGGDFRIAILMGLLLGFPLLLIGFFATYISGSIVGISLLLFQYIKTGKFQQSMMIPFGPFLAFGIFLALFFGDIYWEFVRMYL